MTVEIGNCFEELNSNNRIIKEFQKKIENLNARNAHLKFLLGDLELELEKRKEIMSNYRIINVIVVDKDRDKVVSNGLVDLNRDVLMKLVGMIDDEKTRNVIGMTGLFYSWSKLRVFYWVRMSSKYSIELLPNSPLSGVMYSHTHGVKINFDEDGEDRTISLKRDLSSSKIFLLDIEVSGHITVGLALKSVLPLLHAAPLWSMDGTCMLWWSGIYVGRSRKHDFTAWDYLSSRKSPVPVRLELNQMTHTLYFFVSHQQLPCCVTKIPSDVCFAIGKGCYDSHTVEIHSLRRIRTSGTAASGARMRYMPYVWTG